MPSLAHYSRATAVGLEETWKQKSVSLNEGLASSLRVRLGPKRRSLHQALGTMATTRTTDNRQSINQSINKSSVGRLQTWAAS
jgi:hypothetical protein